MAGRDYDNFAYYTIAVKKGSKTHEAIVQDAKDHKTKQTPLMLSLRLEELYALKEAGLLLIASVEPGGTKQTITTKTGTLQHQMEDVQVVSINEAQALANLAEADDFFK